MAEEKKKRRRPSKEAQASIDAATSKMREDQIKNAPAKSTAASDDKITYEQWWMIINKKIKLRHHLKEIIWADFKARGAGKMESEAKYDELLKVFGYKW